METKRCRKLQKLYFRCLIITLRRRTTARIMFQAKKYERVTRFDILDPYRTVVANIEIQHETRNDGELYLLDSV